MHPLSLIVIAITLLASCDYDTSDQSPKPTPAIFVSHSATGNNDGSSWSDAHTDLTAAITEANDGDEIWVAAGTYYPSKVSDRSETFQLKSGVNIFGGFNGTEESRSNRNWETNLTTLSGDIGVSAINTDNSFHVVTASDNTILDGFTISNGYSIDAPQGSGAGIRIYDASPTIINCIISNNSASSGGGISSEYNSSSTFKNCTITNNTATQYGGASRSFSSSLYLTNCLIINNQANDGGGFSNLESGATLINCTISGNNATTTGGGLSDYVSSTIAKTPLFGEIKLPV